MGKLTKITSTQRGIYNKFCTRKAYENSKNNLAEFLHSLKIDSSNSENLLEASIYRVLAKLAVRDKFEFLLYFLRLQPSSSFDLHVALNALAWNVLSELLICRVAYPLLQSAACTLLDIHYC